MGELRGTFEELFRFLLEEHNVVALGLYRRDRESSEQDSGMDAKPVAAAVGGSPASPMKRAGVRKFNQEPSACMAGHASRPAGLPGSPARRAPPRRVGSVMALGGSPRPVRLAGGRYSLGVLRRTSQEAATAQDASLEVGARAAGQPVLPRTKSMRTRSGASSQPSSHGASSSRMSASLADCGALGTPPSCAENDTGGELGEVSVPQLSVQPSPGAASTSTALLSDTAIDAPTVASPHGSGSPPERHVRRSSGANSVRRAPPSLALPDDSGAAATFASARRAGSGRSVGSAEAAAQSARAGRASANELWRIVRRARKRGKLCADAMDELEARRLSQHDSDALDPEAPLYPSTHHVVITNPPACWIVEPDDAVFVLLRSTESLFRPSRSSAREARTSESDPAELYVLGQNASHRLPNISAFMREREAAPRLGIDEGFIDANTAMLTRLRAMELSLGEKVDRVVAAQARGQERLASIEDNLARVTSALASLAAHAAGQTSARPAEPSDAEAPALAGQ